MPRKYNQTKIYSITFPNGEMYMCMTTQRYLSTVWNSHRRKLLIGPDSYIKLEKSLVLDNVEDAKEQLRIARGEARMEYGELFLGSLRDSTFYKNSIQTNSVKVDIQKSLL